MAGDSNIHGVIVRIDSGGGEATASDEMWREMNLLSKKKPTGDLDVRSGGFGRLLHGDDRRPHRGVSRQTDRAPSASSLASLISMASTTRWASPRMPSSAASMPISIPITRRSRPTNANCCAWASTKATSDFVSKVATARHRTYDQIEPVAQGRVWLGSQAKEHDLVDELGGLDTAIALVKKKANIPAGEQDVGNVPAARNLFDILMKRSQKTCWNPSSAGLRPRAVSRMDERRFPAADAELVRGALEARFSHRFLKYS